MAHLDIDHRQLPTICAFFVCLLFWCSVAKMMPNASEFASCLKKFKCAFNILVRLPWLAARESPPTGPAEHASVTVTLLCLSLTDGGGRTDWKSHLHRVHPHAPHHTGLCEWLRLLPLTRSCRFPRSPRSHDDLPFLLRRWSPTAPTVCRRPSWLHCWYLSLSTCWARRRRRRSTSCGSSWETPGTSRGWSQSYFTLSHTSGRLCSSCSATF